MKNRFDYTVIERESGLAVRTWLILLLLVLCDFDAEAQIVINEIHYHPKDSIFFNSMSGENDTINGRNFEFVELKNIGASTFCLDGSFICGDTTDFDIPICIPAGGYAVLAEDFSWFQIKYGFPPDAVFSGSLSDDGETLIIKDSDENTIESMTYNDSEPWDIEPDDGRKSLELLNPTFDNNDYVNWFRSDGSWGTPKAENSRVCNGVAIPMVINELNYNSDNINFDPADWVELYNPNGSAVDLSGWTIYDQNKSFVIPQGTLIPSGEHYVFVEDMLAFSSEFPTVPSALVKGPMGFSLANNGERLSVFNEHKCLSDHLIYTDAFPWPIAPDGSGETLALENPTLDNLLPTSWSGSVAIHSPYVHGSPGEANSPGCPEDITGDGIVDVNDFIAFNSEFLSTCTGCPADITGDGIVDITDFLAMNSQFGQVCE